MIYFDVTICQVIALVLFMHLFFALALKWRRNDIADVAWGLGFVLLALVAVLYNFNLKTAIVFLLVSVWGLRLASHIYARFRSHQEEDARYRQWREQWGAKWKIYSYLKVFLLQGSLLFVVAAPILVIARYSAGEWYFMNSVGVLIWIFGFAYELMADLQLKRFVQDKKVPGSIMKSGLWRYSRHPNYFGEAVLWWGMGLLAWGLDYFLLALVGPLVITFLLRFVSGVPLAEKRYDTNQEFQEYKRRTPAIIPNYFIK